MLASCGNKKQPETLEEQAVEESFTPGDKTTALDTLNEIDEMVEAVETKINGINGTKYNAEFFNNSENKADKATADKYAQTPSGLKYVIANEGTGKSPKATDKVTVHYVGTLTDGTQFDSSIDRGEPIDFPLNGVIPGWTEGLQLMKEGGTAVFYIPSNLAYGERGVQNPYTGEYSIPPSAPLIFWVQLIQVN
ncbi:MAG: FKBP-type peptidyl-prolyl cis-trans isomerase [Muribaculaceae bacterium]|nr:FKBP-type peptidyl-prolyl cis-trans isomerase [Muribaculaceae bacterium]